jgi:hypothetical protein
MMPQQKKSSVRQIWNRLGMQFWHSGICIFFLFFVCEKAKPFECLCSFSDLFTGACEPKMLAPFCICGGARLNWNSYKPSRAALGTEKPSAFEMNDPRPPSSHTPPWLVL